MFRGLESLHRHIPFRLALISPPRSCCEGPQSSTPPSRLPQPTNTFGAEHGIIVLVGPTQKKNVVHESHITRDSEFFSAALGEARIEGQVTFINLPSEDPVHLAYYLDWVYDRKLPTDTDQASLPVPSCITADYANELLVLLSQL